MKKWIFAICFLSFLGIELQAQTDPLEEAKAFERQYNTAQAILKYQEALKINPHQFSILVRLIEIYSHGVEQPRDKATIQKELNKANDFLSLTKTIDSTNADYLYIKAVYLGKLIEISSVKEKAQYTKEIKILLDQALTITPNHLKSIYTLAKWNEEIASLNPAVKTAMKVVFGGIPPASREQAIELHEKARKLNPGFLANNLDLALLYKKTNQPSRAIEILEAQMKLPTRTKEELEIKNTSKQLLQSFQ